MKSTSLPAVAAVVLLACFCMQASADHTERTAKLTVLTEGQICEVYVDGEYFGKSPVSLFVTPGKHHVEAVTDDDTKKKKTIRAKAFEECVVSFEFPPPPVEDVEADDSFNIGIESSDGTFRLILKISGGTIAGGTLWITFGDEITSSSSSSSSSSPPYSHTTVSQRDVTISVRSDAPDGDRIDLAVNGNMLLDDHVLTGADHLVNVTLDGGVNNIIVTARNEGTTPLNTGVLSVSHVSSGSDTWSWQLADGACETFYVAAP